MDWQQILNDHYDEFCYLAQEVGIDGAALYQRLPASGQLLMGNAVPVITPSYRGKCSVLFYINYDSQGGSWPYIRFMSFKHGGVQRVFNGSRLNKARPFVPVDDQCLTKRPAAQIKPQFQVNDNWRKQQFWASSQQYYSAKEINDIPWLNQRLQRKCNPILLRRAGLRMTQHGELLAPISHPNQGLVGYHKITPQRDNQKRHAIYRAGLLKGAAIVINPNPLTPSSAIGLCEGLITGLSLALVWPGSIYVALTAGNLAAVRGSLSDKSAVTIFADNDCWKPQVGNTGVSKAYAAAQPSDKICVPQFSQMSQLTQPTDFNDLLVAEGIAELRRQVFHD